MRYAGHTEELKMLRKIDHINIVVDDIEKCIEFFELLGFQVEDRADLRGEWVSLIVGLKDVDAEYVKLALPRTETRIELIHFEHPQAVNRPQQSTANQYGLRHIAFEVDDIDTVVNSLRKKGVRFMSEVQAYPKTGKKLVYFYGPEGILLELAQYNSVSDI
jgi:catechol 2,3-dioxygenase-like lactoylglutathione lyase family enzyme